MTSKTKPATTPATYAALLASTEDTQRQKYDANAARLAALRGLPAKAEADLEDAQDALSDIEGAHSRHDGSGDLPTALEHAEAVSRVILAERREKGARVLLERAGKAYSNTDTEVAQAFCRAAAVALPGVEVIPTFVQGRNLPAITPEQLPCAVVVQQSRSVHDATSGTLSAESVEVHYLRGPVHSQVDQERVLAAANRLGYRVEPIGFVNTSEGADRTVDVMRLKVWSAHLFPVIPKMADEAEKALAANLAQQIAGKCNLSGWGVKMLDRGALRSSHVLVKADAAALVNREVEDGIRKVTVEAFVLVRPTEDVWGTVPKPGYAVDTILRDMAAGGFVPGLGVVESIELLPISSDSPLTLAVMATSARLDSVDNGPKDAHRSPLSDSQYIVRAVLVSAVDAEAAAA